MDIEKLKQSLVIQGGRIIKLEDTIKKLTERIDKLESRIPGYTPDTVDYSITEMKNQLLLVEELSDWESHFVHSLRYTSESIMSSKQKETLKKIYKAYVKKFAE